MSTPEIDRVNEARYPTRPSLVNQAAMLEGYNKLPEALAQLGFQEMRKGQDAVVVNILAQRDTICILPTATGKSACFVLPTLCHNWHTIVFSPLVALMRDQVQGLWKKNIRAGQMSGMQSEAENLMAARQWASGELQFLYVAPERLDNEMFKQAIQAQAPDFVVMDEAHCFPGDTYVPTEFGNRSLLDLWNSHHLGLPLPRVLSQNKTGEIVWSPILKVMQQPKKALIRVRLEASGSVRCTADHVWFTALGERAAGTLKPGDLVYTTNLSGERKVRGLNADQLQIAIGSYLGDGGFSRVSKKANTFRFALTHCRAQADYCIWKMRAFRGSVEPVNKNGYSQTPAVRGRTPVFQLPQEGPAGSGGRWGKKTRVPAWMLEAMDERALAIWAMDDGSGSFNALGNLNGFTFATHSFSKPTVEKLRSTLRKKFGIRARASYAKGWYLRLRKQDALILRRKIVPYLHPDMAYKVGVPANAVPGYEWNAEYSSYLTRVLSVSDAKGDLEDLFDIEVEDCHNFFALTTTGHGDQGYVTDVGVLVHNCLSQWSDNFRPAYCKIGDFIAQHNPKVVAAFTATCPDEVEDDVRRVLGLGTANKIVHFPRRKNLKLSSTHLSNDWDIVVKIKEINGPVIVYCASTTTVEKFAEYLSNSIGEEVTIFHGKLTDDAKRTNMDQFMTDKVRVVVATNAFGMGVDKPNIRGVIHYDFPGSIEALSQEVGRAGRDGFDSQCITYYRADALKTQRWFIQTSHPSAEDIRRVYQTLCNLVPQGDVVKITTKELARMAKIHEASSSAVMSILKGSKVIENAKAEDKLAKVKIVGHTDEARFQQYITAIQQSGTMDHRTNFIEFDMNFLTTRLGVSYAVVRNWLTDWDKGGLIKYLAPFRGMPLRVIGDLTLVDFPRLKRKADEAHEKLAKVLEYVEKVPDAEKHDFLEKYFQMGEGSKK